MRPLSCLAPLAIAFGLASTAFGQALEPTNLGPWRANVFRGHVLTPPPAPGADAPGDRILYCPSEDDDPAWRAAVSVAAGGATVDYFDARAAVPSLALLMSYDAIHTWTNFAYFDKDATGTNLSAANDLGKDIILGVFCTYTSGNSLGGAIMGPAYSPVLSPLGTNHFTSSPYVGDGVSCIYNGVTALDSGYRDVLVLQGTGVVDGTALDGELVHAYRTGAGPGMGQVVYQNGCGAAPLAGTGQWAQALANAALCNPATPMGTCTFRDGKLGLNPKGYFCVTAPTSGQVWSATIDMTPSIGSMTLQSFLVAGLSGPIEGAVLFGHELLTLPPYVLDKGFGSHDNLIPPGLTGGLLYTQGARLEVDSFGVLHIVLMNAQDLMIG